MNIWMAFPKLVGFFWGGWGGGLGHHNEDFRILGSILGLFCFGKLPYIYIYICGLKKSLGFGGLGCVGPLNPTR